MYLARHVILTRGSRVGRLKTLTTIRGLAIESKAVGKRKQALGWAGRRSAMAGGVGHAPVDSAFVVQVTALLSSATDVVTKGIESQPEGVQCERLRSFGKHHRKLQ